MTILPYRPGSKKLNELSSSHWSQQGDRGVSDSRDHDLGHSTCCLILRVGQVAVLPVWAVPPMGSRGDPRPPMKKRLRGGPSEGASGAGPGAKERIGANQSPRRSLTRGLEDTGQVRARCTEGRS